MIEVANLREMCQILKMDATTGAKHWRKWPHFFATEAIRGGADLKAVAEILGHANLTMILTHYQHTIREQKRTAMNAITMPPDQPAWVKRGDQGHKKAPKVTHEEKNILQ